MDIIDFAEAITFAESIAWSPQSQQNWPQKLVEGVYVLYVYFRSINLHDTDI